MVSHRARAPGHASGGRARDPGSRLTRAGGVALVARRARVPVIAGLPRRQGIARALRGVLRVAEIVDAVARDVELAVRRGRHEVAGARLRALPVADARPAAERVVRRLARGPVRSVDRGAHSEVTRVGAVALPIRRPAADLSFV